MITLNELFDVTWNITVLNITAREPGGRFLHEWLMGEGITESIHMRNDREDGKLTFMPVKINYHGDDNGRGTSEIGCGVKESLIPKELREAPVTHLIMRERYHSGTVVYCDVEMQPLTCEAVMNREENNARDNVRD